jgi:hypothetical protein
MMECGVWKGGTSLLMRAVLKWHGSGRTVWVADSFQGLPPASYLAPGRSNYEEEDLWSALGPELAIPLGHVKHSFQNLGLLDSQVQFVQGFFNDTMPKLRQDPRLDAIAVLRLDGDMYESYMDVLFFMYDRVPIGGFIIADDYGIEVAAKAIDDFRDWHGISSVMYKIDDYAVYWQKEKHTALQMNKYEQMRQDRR